MNVTLREYLLKGLFLSLWAYLAIQLPWQTPDWNRFGNVVLITGIGLVLGLFVGAFFQFQRGYRPWASPLGFLLTVLLESPFWIYLGVIGGLGVGIVLDHTQHGSDPAKNWLAYFVAGGLVLGYGFYQLRQVKEWIWRLGIAAGIGAALVYLALSYISYLPGIEDPDARRTFGIIILVGLPFFYLLSFCGETEESEVEIAALCAAMGIGLDQLGLSSTSQATGGKLVLIAPVIVYFLYATRILPGLRVFKHTLRGYSALRQGQPVQAAIAFRKALRLNPANTMASEGMWALHQHIDLSKLPADAELFKHLDYEFCLDRAAAFLLGETPPTAEERAKAFTMLDLVSAQQPRLQARTDYLRVIGLTHAKDYDGASATLRRLLDPTAEYDQRVRHQVLFNAWDLALRLHPELQKRVGNVEIDQPRRRMEAIAVIERRLASGSGDALASQYKEMLYAGLTEEQFLSSAERGLPERFNYDYVEQLGLALIDDVQPERRDRGMAFLRIAGRGLPQRGPSIFMKLAKIAQELGRVDEARGYYEQVKRTGHEVGAKQLDAEQQKHYFEALQILAADAEARGDFTSAVADLRLYMESGKHEMETFRKMADLYEQAKDPMNALLMVETALVYNSKDADLLARKDRYYYSVDPARVEAVKDKVERFFDVEYCLKKAKQVLDSREVDVESLDWASHLIHLSRILQPQRNAVNYAWARILLRKGERDEALRVLEDLREAKRGSGDEEDAWFGATRTLAELYFNEFNKPELAVHCYLDYRDYTKSGADTLFQIARCYEAMGELGKAKSFYETVTAYDQHPRYYDANEALRRLREQQTTS